MDLRVLFYDYCVRYFIPHPFNSATKIAGRDFVSGFLKWNKDFSLCKPQGVALNCVYRSNKTGASLFFEILDSVFQQYAFEPHQIYNCGETGLTCVHKPHVYRVCTIWVDKDCTYNDLYFLCGGYFFPSFMLVF